MRDCAKECYLTKTICQNKECRLSIDYEEDLNCTIVAVQRHGPMTLEEIGKKASCKHREDKADRGCHPS